MSEARQKILKCAYKNTLGGGQGKKEVGDEGAGGGGGRRGGGRRKKRGWEEGEEGREEEEERKRGREGGRKIKKVACGARAAPKRKEGDKGREGEVRGGKWERHTLCPSPHTSW